MATYVVTLKQGFGKTGKAKIENRTVRVVAPDSKSARQIAETAGWSAIQAVPAADSQKRRLSPFPRNLGEVLAGFETVCAKVWPPC